MTTPKVLVLRAPGTNCDHETKYAFELAGGQAERVHLNRVLENPALVEQYQIMCIPGGFSYGDDVAAGRIFANQLRSQLADVMHEFKNSDKLILGICNGFQVLIKSGLLLEDDAQGDPPATLCWNNHGLYEDRWVTLQNSTDKCVFLRGVQQVYLPIAHAEGKFVMRDQHVADQLESNQQLALRYVNADGGPADGFPENPNGAQRNVAGVCDDSGRVFGLMPHPERFLDGTQHPRWTREGLQQEGDGVAIFRNAVEYFA